MSKNFSLSVVSLFAGAGGLDLGLIQAGHNVIWAVDNCPDCCKTYSKNIGNHILEADIENVDLNDIPDSDVVVGGFPCQGFSVANLKRAADDDRNKLYRAFVKIVRSKRPRYFIAENVRGILNLEKGKVIEQILKDFKDCGYSVDCRVYNAADFGVPQNRVRVFIVGVRDDIDQSFLWAEPLLTLKENWVSIGEALKDIPEPETQHSLLNHVGSKYKVTNRNFTGHRKTDPDKPSPTILARGNGKGGVCAIQHPDNHRRMTVREQALVQTFPIDFEFIGKLGSMYRQVGNAVPVKLAYHMGLALSDTESAFMNSTSCSEAA